MPERDPRARFVDLANKRVTNAIKQIRLVGNLANRRAYEYSEADAKKIVRALQAEIGVLRAQFEGTDRDDASIFTL